MSSQQQTTPLDKQAAADKRVAQREQKVQAGIQDLDQWLQDLMRQGLASAQTQPYSFWEGVAARMVDAQAPGLARRLRSCGAIPYSGEGWPQQLLDALGKLYLLVQGYQRLELLPPGLRAEVRTQVGWTIKKNEVLALATTSAASATASADSSLPLLQFDHWQVVGIRVLEEDQLWSQRVWLWGVESDRPALILNFSYGSPRFDQGDISLVPGITIPAELAFYPSSYPLRALVNTVSGAAQPMTGFLGGISLGEAIAHYGYALSQNPWLDRMVLIIDGVIPGKTDRNWWVRDFQGQRVPLHPQFSQEWELLAVSGGKAMAIAAEWDGTYLWPLSIATNQPEQRLILLG